MLEIDKVSLSFSAKTLLDKVSFTLFAKQKYGLVGKNGVGKTSLFHLITGKVKPDGGDIFYPKSSIVTAIDQECKEIDLNCIDYVINGYPIIGPIYRKVKELERSARDNFDYEKIADLYAQIDNLQGFDIESRAATILDGLGFSQEDLLQPLSSFSGGWQMRMNLAKCLLVPSDILLLDEPTNHLDMDAILWLEKWLNEYQGSLILISHDRVFLDKVIDNVVLLENQTLKTFKGNYSSYEEQKYLLSQGALKQRDKIEKKRDHLLKFINKFKAKASKAKQAQSRIKILEKLPIIETVTAEKNYNFSFFIPQPLSNPALELKQVNFSYDQQSKVLEGVNFSLAPDQKVGLLGFNGAGKTTLMKLLAGKLKIAPLSRVTAKNLKVGYFAQHQIEALELDKSPLWHLQRLSQDSNTAQLRTYLGHFAFSNEMALEPVKYFSGGEKSRLALALLIWQKPNVLLLDEPTNHLDLALRQSLCKALAQYEGALVLVSHDRYILEATVDEFYLVHNHKVSFFDGDLDDYDKWSVETKKAQKKSYKKVVDNPVKNDKTHLIQKELSKIEKKIDKVQYEIELIDREMLALSSEQHIQLMELASNKLDLEGRLSHLESQWLDLSESL